MIARNEDKGGGRESKSNNEGIRRYTEIRYVTKVYLLRAEKTPYKYKNRI
jgi:hypothetical protein